jgi:integrase
MSGVLTMPSLMEDYDPLRDKRYREAALGPDIVAWLAWLKLGGTARRTLDQYERDLARGALLFPSRSLAELTDGDLFQIACQFKPGERRVRVAAWRSFLKWAVRTRRIERNPADQLPEIKKRPQPVIRVFTDPEIEALLSLPVVDAAPLAVLLEAGLRKAEARNLRLQDALPESGQVIVLKGKGQRDRVVPMTGRLKYLLNELALTERLDPKDHIFYAVRANATTRSLLRDRPIGEGTFARWWRSCLDGAHVRYRTPHTARHTFATRWRRAGLALDEIQILLGHSSIKTTSDLYVHTKVADVAEHMAMIEAGSRA